MKSLWILGTKVRHEKENEETVDINESGKCI